MIRTKLPSVIPIISLSYFDNMKDEEWEIRDVRPTIYFLINKGEVVYIGLTTMLGFRIYTHKLSKKIFDSFGYIQVKYCEGRKIESRLIRAFLPKYNKLINPPREFNPRYMMNGKLANQIRRD
jgi:hypothetical protein